MPRFERNDAAGPLVRGFAGSAFLVDGERYRAVLITPTGVHPWEPPAVADLAADDLAILLGMVPQPEFILLGTGATLRRPPPAFVRDLDHRGIGVEAMDSRAAARTWGVLRAEERWIAAALMPFA